MWLRGVQWIPTTRGTKEDEEGDEEEVWREYQSSTSITYGAPHPGYVVQGAAFASVDPPPTSYPLRDSLGPQIASGALSKLQLEGIAYACDRHRKFLADGKTRAGFMVADSTGIGKGRQMAGIILDNIQRGRKRHAWISLSNDLGVDATRDLRDIGCDARIFLSIGELFDSKTPVHIGTDEACVMFCTYSQLMGKGKKKGKPRYDQLVEFLTQNGSRESFEGVIIFDESHRAKNYRLNPNSSSMTGTKVVALQTDLPSARVVYSSATAITSVVNMGYLTRMGLWGLGTKYPTFKEFQNAYGNMKVSVAVLEMMAIGFKASGSQVARNVGYKGAEFEKFMVDVSREKLRMYDAVANLLNDTMRSIQLVHDLGALFAPSSIGKNVDVYLIFSSLHQRIMREMITSFKIDSVVDDARKMLDAGYSVVIGTQSTGEASTMRELKKIEKREEEAEDAAEEEEEEEEEDENSKRQKLTTTPASSVVYPRILSACESMYESFMTDYFPVLHIAYVEEETEREKDVKKEYVEVKEAAEIRDALIAKARSLNMPANSLDDILDKFGGPSVVAEMTGRKRRMEKSEDGAGYVIRARTKEPRTSGTLNVQEREKFQSGAKRVAVISDAASTGVSLHAARTAKNQSRRIHYTLELPWAADRAIQQLGRTHRTNQVSAPLYKLVSTPIGGEVRFVSSVARRLQSLGALTQGDKSASLGSKTFGAIQYESTEGNHVLREMVSTKDVAVSISEKEEESAPSSRTQYYNDSDGHSSMYSAPLARTWRLAWKEVIPLLSSMDSALATETFPSIKLGSAYGAMYPTPEEAARVLSRAIGYIQSQYERHKLRELEVSQFMNKLLGMPVVYQTFAFHYFANALAATIIDMKIHGKYNKGAQTWTQYGVSRVPGTSVESVPTRDGGKVDIHTLSCDRGLDFPRAMREFEYILRVRDDPSLRREDVPLLSDEAALRKKWDEVVVPATESHKLIRFVISAASKKKEAKKDEDEGRVVGLAIQSLDGHHSMYDIVSPAKGLMELESVSGYSIDFNNADPSAGDRKWGAKVSSADFDRVKRMWSRELTNDVATRTFTTLLITGSVIPFWKDMESVTYVPPGSKPTSKPKKVEVRIVKVVVDGKRLTGLTMPTETKKTVIDLISDSRAPLRVDEVTPVASSHNTSA